MKQATREAGNGSRPTPAPQRRATAERRGELHEALVAAVERLLERDGINSVRARTLAETAGCSVGAIYNVVPDLDALILEANGRTLAAIDAALRNVSAGDKSTESPASRLTQLGLAYLDYAASHTRRWSALFAHRMTGGAEVPTWYRMQQAAMFTHVEAPLALLQPNLSADACALLARSLFSAVHGVVSLGLSETLVSIPLPVQRAQLGTLLEAMARGLAQRVDR